MIATCAAFAVVADRRDGHPGSWVAIDGPAPRKIGALGIRVERGVSYHGIALNVDPDLRDFDLIDPCGMPGVASTSIAVEAGRAGQLATTATIKHAAAIFAQAFASRIGATLHGHGADSINSRGATSAAPAATVVAAR